MSNLSLFFFAVIALLVIASFSFYSGYQLLPDFTRAPSTIMPPIPTSKAVLHGIDEDNDGIFWYDEDNVDLWTEFNGIETITDYDLYLINSYGGREEMNIELGSDETGFLIMGRQEFLWDPEHLENGKEYTAVYRLTDENGRRHEFTKTFQAISTESPSESAGETESGCTCDSIELRVDGWTDGKLKFYPPVTCPEMDGHPRKLDKAVEFPIPTATSERVYLGYCLAIHATLSQTEAQQYSDEPGSSGTDWVESCSHGQKVKGTIKIHYSDGSDEEFCTGYKTEEDKNNDISGYHPAGEAYEEHCAEGETYMDDNYHGPFSVEGENKIFHMEEYFDLMPVANVQGVHWIDNPFSLFVYKMNDEYDDTEVTDFERTSHFTAEVENCKCTWTVIQEFDSTGEEPTGDARVENINCES